MPIAAVLHVVPAMDGRNTFGGPATVADALANSMGDAFAVTIVSGYRRCDGSWPGRSRPTAHHRQVAGRRLVGRAPGSLIGIRLLLRVVLATARSRTVIVHGSREPLSAVAIVAALVLRRRVLVLTHGMLEMPFSRVRRGSYSWFCARLLRRVHGVYVLTEAEREVVGRAIGGLGRVCVLPNAVEASLGAPLSSERRHWDVVFVGRLHPRKGVRLFVDSVRALLATRTDVTIAIAGPDEGEGHLAEGLADEFPGVVTYLGALSAVDARRLISQARTIACLAVGEPYGLTVVEAFREHTAVLLAPGYALATEWTRLNCIVSVPYDAAAISAAAQSLLDDPARRSAVTASAARWAAEHAGYEAMVAALMREP